jgi:hypothetical protein
LNFKYFSSCNLGIVLKDYHHCAFSNIPLTLFCKSITLLLFLLLLLLFWLPHLFPGASDDSLIPSTLFYLCFYKYKLFSCPLEDIKCGYLWSCFCTWHYTFWGVKILFHSLTASFFLIQIGSLVQMAAESQCIIILRNETFKMIQFPVLWHFLMTHYLYYKRIK